MYNIEKNLLYSYKTLLHIKCGSGDGGVVKLLFETYPFPFTGEDIFRAIAS